MENYDQRVTIFFALCPLSYDIILGVVRQGIDGLRRRLGGETSGEERKLLKTSSCHTACAFGRKGRSGKLQKELTEMNRITTTLCVMAVLAMATLALPAPSYPSNAFSGFAEVLVCLKSRSSAEKVFYDLRSFGKMVVNSTTATARQSMLFDVHRKRRQR